MSDVISVYSPDWDAYSGYGRMALELAWGINEAGLHVNALGTPNTHVLRESQSDAVQALLNKPIQISTGGLLLGYPTLFEKFGEMANMGKRVAITMFESTKLPPKWVLTLNQVAAVIVPTEAQKKIFRANGVVRPIHVVPLGVSRSFYPETDGTHQHALSQYPVKRFLDGGSLIYRRVMHKPTAVDPYIFVTWGDRGTRKGWEAAVQAFHKAFDGRDDVRLVIKCRPESLPYTFEKIPNVIKVEDDLSEAALNDFYLRCDAMVFPSHGEGFGLPPREFAATGGPAIAAEWWADDIQTWGYPVRSTLVKAWQGHPELEGLGKWADVDVLHLAELMTHVTSQNPKLIEYMSGRSAMHVRKVCDWSKFVERVLAIYQEAKQKPVKGKRHASA